MSAHFTGNNESKPLSALHRCGLQISQMASYNIDAITSPLPPPKKKIFYFEHPHPLLVDTLGWALQGHTGAGHSSDTLGLGTRLWGGETDTLGLGSRETLAHRRETLGLGTPGTFWGWALQEGDSGAGHSRETGVGHSRRLWCWALWGHSGAHSKFGHSGTGWAERGVDRARRRVPGEEKS